MIWSKTEKYPTYEDIDHGKAFTNWTDSIVLEKKDIYEGTYYLSVYAFALSEYTINLAIQRSEGLQMKIPEIKLSPGITYFHTLFYSQSEMCFVFSPHIKAQVKI